MPFIALRGDERVIPDDVSDGEDVYCTECGGLMRTRGPFADGRDRHFYHIDNVGGSCSGPGPDSDPGPAESETHEKLKMQAVTSLREWQDEYRRCGPEIALDVAGTATAVGQRRADALLVFSESNRFFGRGVIVEVQHLNTGKDIRATTHDYLEQGFSVYWATVDDFYGDGFLIEEMEEEFNAGGDAAFTPYRDPAPPLEAPQPLIAPDGNGPYTTTDLVPECNHDYVHSDNAYEVCVRCGMKLERCFYDENYDRLRSTDTVMYGAYDEVIVAAVRDSVEHPVELKPVEKNGEPPDHNHSWGPEMPLFDAKKHLCSQCDSVMIVTSEKVLISNKEKEDDEADSWREDHAPWE